MKSSSLGVMLLASGGVLSLCAATARAEGGAAADSAAAAAAAADAADAASGPAIIVTGVRGRPRTVTDSPVPIDVISPQELKSTGRTGLKDILGNIIPSLSMPALGGGGTSASVRPISIRGLSGDYLLVLVNGKRRHTTSLINNLSRISGGSTPVDIDLIATAGVGRIEVLRDGAAAQYGSDAIAGVINIILDNTPTGGDLSFTGGQQYSKGAGLLQGTLSAGTRLGDEGGFIRVAVEAKYHDNADSSALPVPYIYPFVNGQPDPREASANHLIAGGYGRSNRDEIVNTSINAELPVGNGLTAYAFSTLSYRNIKDARGAVFPSPTGYGGQANTQSLTSLPQIYPDGFQAYRRISEWDWQPTLGLKGDVAGWGFDLSTSYGQDNVKLGASGTLNPSLGPTSPTSFFMGRQKQDLWVSNLDFNRDFEVGLAAPVTVAVGTEYRWEKFQNVAGEPDSYRDGGYVIPIDSTPFGLAYGGRTPSPGLVSFTGTSPADASSISRNNIAGYIDVSSTIVRGWYVGVAGRFEHYSDSAGNTFSAKFSTRYEILPGLAIRGGVNTGFRAPSLAQTAFSTTQNTATVIGNERVSTTAKFLPVNSAAAIALGAQPLKPEKSLNFTAGATYESGRFRLTIDAYQIRIDDRIVKTDFLGTASNGGKAVAALLAANGVTDVDSAQFFTNAIDSRTRGVDVVSEYSISTARAGNFRLSAAYSYNKTKILHVIPNPSQLSSLNIVLFGRQVQNDLVEATPNSKVILTANWTLGPVHALLRATRYGSYTESSTVAASDRTYGAKWVADLEVGTKLTDKIDVSVGANNLFDTYPQKNGIVAADGSGLYGSFAPFGLSGGFYYARVGYTF
jgi:iron complex outermembrane receptor protein